MREEIVHETDNVNLEGADESIWFSLVEPSTTASEDSYSSVSQGGGTTTVRAASRSFADLYDWSASGEARSVTSGRL